MWLLNSSTNELRLFISEEDLPPYAILSHTWGEEEVAFQDWQAAYSEQRRYGALPEDWKERSRGILQALSGYKKIERCQHQARADGLQWVWADTCCIDKQSSAELSEAINSMYRWYHGSTVCYAYLEDVGLAEGESTTSEIGHSRWFTRGWTLQELLAPRNVEFYTREWTKVGTKTSLAPTLQSTTGIEKKYLTGDNSIHEASISKRMSWASNRNTTRVEDTAYALLGIFDINMPLLYGEGAKAFERLQHALMREFPQDHTLYAWGTVVDKSLPLHTLANGKKVREETPVRHNETPKLLLGLLADSPRAFSGSGSFIPVSWAHETFAPHRSPDHKSENVSLHCAPAAVVGRTIRLDNPVFAGGSYLRHLNQPNVTQVQAQSCSPLLCTDEKDRSVLLHIFLVRRHIGLYGRTEELARIRASLAPTTFRRRKLACDIAPEPAKSRNLNHGSIVIRTMFAKIASIEYGSPLQQSAWVPLTQHNDTSSPDGGCDWVWPVCRGVRREHLTVFTLPVDDAPLEDTGIILVIQAACKGDQKDYVLIGRENGLFKIAAASAVSLFSALRSPLLYSHVFSASYRDSTEFPLNEGKKAFVAAERVFFAGWKFVDFFDFRVEEPREEQQVAEAQEQEQPRKSEQMEEDLDRTLG